MLTLRHRSVDFGIGRRDETVGAEDEAVPK